ncbi:MAG: hypothetical protein HOI47_02100, partial [Candidatus Scalindua sp.]|nr:hypothetical protein [Candidatus Scalindua sp.]
MILKSEKILIIAIITLTLGFFTTNEVCFAVEDEGLYVEVEGNVGIGTTDPSYLLQLLKNGSAAPIQLDIHNTGTNDADDSILSFGVQGLIDFGMGIDRSTGKFTITKGKSFLIDNFFTIDDIGNIGIGTLVSGGLLGLKDEFTYLDRDDNNNLTFTDVVTGTKTLADLIKLTYIEIAEMGFVTGAHTVDTDTHIDQTGIEGLGFTAGAHTVDTTLDQSGVEGLGFVTGSHTVDTDTHIDQTGIEGLGFTAGAHTVDTTLDQSGVEGLGFVAGAHTVDTDTHIDQTGIEG